MTRQHEQNMIDLNRHGFHSWKIDVKITCVFKNWTIYEFQKISKFLLTNNVLIPEESKGIKQREESENLEKLYGNNHWQLTSKFSTTIQCTCGFQ